MPPTASYDEKDLLLKIAEGDEKAFEQLFYLYQNNLAAFILRLTNSRAMTQEIVQDVFFKIWSNRSSLKEIDKFESYLFVVAKHHAFNCLKKAAREGYVFIAWTNTIANMPAWNAIDSRLGNNPLVFALPYNNEAIVLDMAMSQFSYGSMELAIMKNEKLKVQGGYDSSGNLTDDPAAILESKRPLPIGYWKGAGLSLLLDLLATILSGGSSTSDITRKEAEFSVSQVFICVDISKLPNQSLIAATVNNIISDYHNSIPINKEATIVYPGERVLAIRKRNFKNGIPVVKTIWEEIMNL